MLQVSLTPLKLVYGAGAAKPLEKLSGLEDIDALESRVQHRLYLEGGVGPPKACRLASCPLWRVTPTEQGLQPSQKG